MYVFDLLKKQLLIEYKRRLLLYYHDFDFTHFDGLVLHSDSVGEGSRLTQILLIMRCVLPLKIQKAINTVYCGLHDFDFTHFDGLVLRSDSVGEGSRFAPNFLIIRYMPLKIQKAINTVYCFLNNI